VALGDWRSTVRVLNRLSFLYLNQDDFARASHYAEQALAALPETDPPADLWAISLTDLGLSAWAQGRYQDALYSLEKALALLEEIGTDLYSLARCLNSLGQVHLAQGELTLADRRFARSLALRQEIGDWLGEAWCWLNQGRAALARGDPVTARERLTTAQTIFTEIQHPFGLETCAQVLAEVEQAERGGHATRRRTVRLAGADAPTGRPLRDDEHVVVNWTVDAPEDEVVAGKAARRRHRLARLLQEAHDQGGAPTVEDLADALQVSQPTIKRDLSALRQAGYQVYTRGSRGR
jgi:tetratricopeptide (TPR) repeat protein